MVLSPNYFKTNPFSRTLMVLKHLAFSASQKKQKIYFSWFWKFKGQDKGAGRFCIWWGSTLWVVDRIFAYCVLTCWNVWEGSLCLFHKGTTYIYQALLSWPNHLPKAPPPNTIILGIMFQHEFWGHTSIQAIAKPKCKSCFFFSQHFWYLIPISSFLFILQAASH